MTATTTTVPNFDPYDDFSLRPFGFTDKDFEYLRRLIMEHTSIQITEMKREMVYGRVSRRLRQLGLQSFAEYCELLQGENNDEIGHLINAITTNLTSFFRERHHFDYLRDTVIPTLKQTNEARRRIRIWSAGCSSGEEAYSIAMILCDAQPMFQGWDVKILATDIDTRMLEKANPWCQR